MPDQSKPVSRPRRRFLRFSVRGMIVVVLLIGGWLGWIVRSARIQREAVSAITTSGGSVKYDWEEMPARSSAMRRPWAPEYFVNLVGVDYFGHVTTVGVSLPTDETFAQVGRLTQLETLIFEANDVSDAGWAHLKGLKNLSSIGFGVSRFSDGLLAHLNVFPGFLTSVSAAILSPIVDWCI